MIFLWGANPGRTTRSSSITCCKGVHNGAKPVRRGSAADPSARGRTWLGLNVGSDIALANAMARVIIHEGLANTSSSSAPPPASTRIARGRDIHAERAPRSSPGCPPRTSARPRITYARAARAMICWTLGITEHHNAVDNVLSLINLALLTGHVGRYGSGLNPLRGQNNVQGGGDMGAIPNRLVGFQDILDPDVAARFETAWKIGDEARRYGMAHDADVRGHAAPRADRALRDRREPGAVRSRPASRAGLLEGLEHLVVQDIFLTRPRSWRTWCCPAASSWCEAEGTVTNSERRVQRVRKALDPPGDARDEHVDHRARSRSAWGHDWATPTRGSRVERGARHWRPNVRRHELRAPGRAGAGLQWPCPERVGARARCSCTGACGTSR